MHLSELRHKTAPALGCALLAAVAVAVHGYHAGADDAGIWEPAIKKAADPSLYPFGDEFFMQHAHLSLFPRVLGWLTRFSGVSPDLAIFLCHLAGVFLLLLASRQLLAACFESERARWAGVATLAITLSVPVAGTAMPIMDPYVTARTLSTPLAVFALASHLSGRRIAAAGWLAACGLVHPQMAVFAAGLLGLMEMGRRRAYVLEAAPVFGLLSLAWLPGLWEFAPAHGAARVALLSRSYFFVSRWAWYEWIGVAAPLAVLWWCSSARAPLSNLLRNLVKFGLLCTAAGVVLSSSPRLENYARLQPMRAFQLVYVVMFLVLGALAGEYVLRNRAWRWLALFVPLAGGMWALAAEQYPASRHVEWAGAPPRGDWGSAFRWVRDHTPKDAVFALDPDYLQSRGEDMHGFRAVAERSALADRVKDSGAVSLFPGLAADWDAEVRAENGWSRFSAADFARLGREFPVTWIIVRRPVPNGLECPYTNAGLAVCRVPVTPESPRLPETPASAGP
jgi:hypothetical protein